MNFHLILPEEYVSIGYGSPSLSRRALCVGGTPSEKTGSQTATVPAAFVHQRSGRICSKLLRTAVSKPGFPQLTHMYGKEWMAVLYTSSAIIPQTHRLRLLSAISTASV